MLAERQLAKGKRVLSSRSAHLTTIPLHVNFSSGASSQQEDTKQAPFMPYIPSSAKRASERGIQSRISSSSTTPNRQPRKVQFNSNNANNNNKTGLQHRRSKSWRPDSESDKSMPYLVPCAAAPPKKASSSTTISIPPDNNNGTMVMMGTGTVGTVTSHGVSLPGSKVACTAPAGTKERVQVCRTKEERDKNPDSVRLDKTGLRLFPDIGGGEGGTLKLLSLQHNLITKLENVPLLTQLVVLDLYDNRIERITGLQGLPSLRVLLLGKNRIRRIEGLDGLKKLEILDLHGNQLRYVDNLGQLTALRVLNLAGNILRNIRNVGPYGLSSLMELNLKRNRIKNLEGLHKCPHLKKLLLANNDLQSFASLAPLRKLVFLQELVIEPNPLVGGTSSVEYRHQVLTLFPRLFSLDRCQVTEEMRQDARLWHKKKLAEEERLKQEEEKLKKEMENKVGPPGSREQIIYQARRRWESLRNFVKNNNNNSVACDNNYGPVEEVKAVKMKQVVKAAKAKDVKDKNEQLYPPATLDLEPFKDGRDVLENTESLLSENETKDLEDNLPVGAPISPSKSPVAPMIPPNQTTNEASPSPVIFPIIKANVNTSDKEDVAQIDSLVDNLENPVCSPSPEITQENEPDAYQGDGNITSTEVPLQETKSSHHFVRDSTTIGDMVEMKTPTCLSENNRSARIAIVRPLNRASELETKSCDTNSFNDTNQSFTVAPSEEETAGMSEAKNLEETVHSSPILAGPSPREKEDQVKPLEGVVKQVEGRSEEARMKSKLLKHLRSVSLDSGTHSFPAPPGPIKPVLSSCALDRISKEEADKNNEEDGLSESESSSSSDDGDDDTQYNLKAGYDDDPDCGLSTGTSTIASSDTPRKSATGIMAPQQQQQQRSCKPSSGAFLNQKMFPRTKSQRLRIRERTARLLGKGTSGGGLTPRMSSSLNQAQGTSTTTKRVQSGTSRGTTESVSSIGGPGGASRSAIRSLRRCDSAASLNSSAISVALSSTGGAGGGSFLSGQSGGGGGNDGQGSTPFRKQGMDFLVEVDDKLLNIFGQGGLRHALTAFPSNVTCHVNTVKFHYISYDSIIPFFGKLRQVYPSLDHFHFRANNLCTLSQLDALSDLQGLSSLYIAKEGNPIVENPAWVHYASYRMSHWGLQNINGKEVCSEYRGGGTLAAQAKGFESLGFLALSCLPQSALTPLARRLHMLHCFCCCSPSTSSDESVQKSKGARAGSPTGGQGHDSSSGSFCTSWNEDPVLLDVIGKEALVYCPPVLPSPADEQEAQLVEDGRGSGPLCDKRLFNQRKSTLGNVVTSGMEILEKVDTLEQAWPTLMAEVIQEILMDFRFTDSYMKKELKKAIDITTIMHHSNHTKKFNY